MRELQVHQTVERASVFLFEDKLLIGLDPVETLVHAGYRVIGPADKVEGALFLLNSKMPKSAIVSILLNNKASTKVVRQNRRREGSFLVRPGDPQDCAAGLDVGDKLRVTKPAAPADLLERSARICEAEGVS